MRVAFFKSFAAYDVPLRPQGPISFEETAGLSSYCIAQLQEDGRIASLTKIIVERQNRGELLLPERSEPGSVIFFKVVAGEEPNPNTLQPMGYAETRDLEAYYQGVVDISGLTLHWEHLLRKPLFTETYSYGPDGNLKERSVCREDGRVSRWTYDENGAPEAACDADIGQLPRG